MKRSVLLCLWLAAGSLGCQSSVVGGECRSGLTVCDGVCVDLDSDPQNCGECGNACLSSQACSFGRCVAYADGSFLDGALMSHDAGASDAAALDAAGLDAGARVCGPGETDCNTGCVNLDDDPSNCGVCDRSCAFDELCSDGACLSICAAGESLCDDECVNQRTDPLNCGACGRVCGDGEICADGTCEAECGPPNTMCGDVCVNLNRDPDHCGMCDLGCPDGICEARVCVAPVPGHLVVIGHDYRQSRPAMRALAGNAVFLSSVYPPRVLVYQEYAEPQAISGTDAAIQSVADSTGRTFTRTVAPTAADVPAMLADAEVLVIYAQAMADDTILAETGVMWSSALGAFLRAGGVVVLFDGDSAHSGTHTLLRPTGLMTTRGWEDASRRVLSVLAPGDAVALGVPPSYRGAMSSIRFHLTSGGGTTVVQSDTDPVVLHRVVVP